MEEVENFLILEDHIVKCVTQDVYDGDIYSKYSKEGY